VVLSHYSGGREHRTRWSDRLLPVEHSVPCPWAESVFLASAEAPEALSTSLRRLALFTHRLPADRPVRIDSLERPALLNKVHCRT
jgi:hypothetical protein